MEIYVKSLVEITNLSGMVIGFGRLWSNPPGSWLKIIRPIIAVGILRVDCSLANSVGPCSQALASAAPWPTDELAC